MKIRRVNKITCTLNSYQFGWLMRELDLEFVTRSFLCGEGPVRWQGGDVGQAQQMEGGDWRVEINGATEKQRVLMDRFSQAKLY